MRNVVGPSFGPQALNLSPPAPAHRSQLRPIASPATRALSAASPFASIEARVLGSIDGSMDGPAFLVFSRGEGGARDAELLSSGTPLGIDRGALDPRAPAKEQLTAEATTTWHSGKQQLHATQEASPVFGAISRLSGAVPELVRSAERGDLTRVRSLLTQGEDPNRTDDLGFTALHCAAKKGRGQVVAALLETGAIANVCATAHGETPLHFACKYGHLKVAQLLLHYRADIGLASREGKTPIQYAAEKQHSRLVEALSPAGQ